MRNSGEPVRPIRDGETYCQIGRIRVGFRWIGGKSTLRDRPIERMSELLRAE